MQDYVSFSVSASGRAVMCIAGSTAYKVVDKLYQFSLNRDALWTRGAHSITIVQGPKESFGALRETEQMAIASVIYAPLE